MKQMIVLLLFLVLATSLAFAGPEGMVRSIELPAVTVDLKDGEGKDRVVAVCAICHSLDYISMQPKFQRAQWSGTVNKMVKVYGAPLSEDDIKKIVMYLVTQYGTGN